MLLVAHQYLLKISQVDEREIFKICLEYWTKLVAELYEEIQQLPVMELPLLNLGAGGMMQPAAGNVALRKNFYADVLARLRVVMIERMVKPEEVCVVSSLFDGPRVSGRVLILIKIFLVFVGVDC